MKGQGELHLIKYTNELDMPHRHLISVVAGSCACTPNPKQNLWIKGTIITCAIISNQSPILKLIMGISP